MESSLSLERVARDLHELSGIGSPVDALKLAYRLGLTLRPWSRTYGALDGNTIRYPVSLRVRPQRAQFVVAHELGHWGLARAGMDASCEASADYIAGALLLPRAAFLSDLEATDWDLFALQRLHPNSSAQAVCVRMTQVSPAATASVWDAGHLHRAYGAPPEQLTASDRELVDAVLTNERPIRGAVSAWPVIDGRWRRVLVVRRAA